MPGRQAQRRRLHDRVLQADGQGVVILGRAAVAGLHKPSNGLLQIGPVIISDAVRGMTRYDVSSDRRWLAVPGPDNNVRVIDTSNGRLYGEPASAGS